MGALPIAIGVRRLVLVLVIASLGGLVSGCGESEPSPRMVKIPNVIGLAADRGIKRLRDAGLCPQPRLASTIGSSPSSVIAALIPVPGERVPELTVVVVEVAAPSQGADVFEFQGC